MAAAVDRALARPEVISGAFPRLPLSAAGARDAGGGIVGHR